MIKYSIKAATDMKKLRYESKRGNVMENLVLVIDSGTKETRGILISEHGEEIAEAEVRYSGYYSTKFGYYEAPASMFWDALTAVCRKLKADFPDEFLKVTALTVSCQRDTSTLIDRSGNPVRDFISWLDRRQLDTDLHFDPKWEILFKISGNWNYAQSFARESHGNWLRQNESSRWKRADYYVLLSTFLIAKLTGKVIDVTSDIAGHFPFNYKDKQWHDRDSILGQILQVEKEKLCDLEKPCTIIGHLTKEAAGETGLPEGVPVAGSGTDKGCETIGVGCIHESSVSVSLGTQATVETTTKKYIELMPFYPSLPSVDPEGYNPEVTLYTGFWMVDWYVKTFAALEKEECTSSGRSIFDFLDEKLLQIPAGSEGLVIQPYWGQESFKKEALGSMIGFTESHTKYHIYRAIIEGIAYALREGIDRISGKTGTMVTRAALSGGGANSDVICQIMADVFGIETYKTSVKDTTALGAAMAAFIALGTYRNLEEAGEKMISESAVFAPNPESSKLYDEIYKQVYIKAYQRYRPLYRALKRIKKSSIRK